MNRQWWDARSNRRDQDRCNGFYYWRSLLEAVRDGGITNDMPIAAAWQQIGQGMEAPQGQCSVDLNSFLVGEYRALTEMESLKGAQAGFQQIADRLAAVIRERMWDPGEKFFFNIRRDNGDQVRVKDIGGLMPLYAGVASEEQARQLVETHLVPEGGPSIPPSASTRWTSTTGSMARTATGTAACGQPIHCSWSPG